MKMYYKGISISMFFISIGVIFVVFLCCCKSCFNEIFCFTCLDNGDIIQFLTLLSTIAGFVIGLLAFNKNNQIKKAEFFHMIRQRFKENNEFNTIREVLYELNKAPNSEVNNTRAKDLKSRPKIDYVGFFEEIELLLEKKLLRQKDVYYMFGEYIIQCDESSEFWKDLQKDDPLWTKYRLLAGRMKIYKEKYNSK